MIVGQNVRMSAQKDRLMQAIRESGFLTPTDAWRENKRALGISQDLMISNTNGNRPISKKAAAIYAEVFGRTAGWYLFGNEGDKTAKEESPLHQSPDKVAELATIFADLIKSSDETQSRALKLLRKTVYGKAGKSREMSAKQSS